MKGELPGEPKWAQQPALLQSRSPGCGIRPDTSEIEAVSRPIVCGGVLVRPGDVIAADSDGVLVIPRVHAREVAADARKLLDGDTAARRLYDPLRIPPDRTLKTPRHP